MARNNNNEEEKPEKPSCCERFRTKMRNLGKFMYNSETKEVMGRTGGSWAKVLTFYFVFYAVYAGFWAVCMVCFIKTLDPDVPTMQKMYSMMKDNPGMSFEPFINGNQTTLIAFDPDKPETFQDYVKQLHTVWDTWKNQTINVTGYAKPNCTAGDGSNGEQACLLDMSFLDNTPCSPDMDFGFRNGTPCVLLRVNRVFAWDPNPGTLDKFPCPNPTDTENSDCAKSLEFRRNVSDIVKSEIKPDYIAVSCQGENDGDADNIIKVTFFPPGGFPAYFFPFYNQKNFTSPLVMARFEVERGRVSMIQCKVWTKDIIHDLNDRQGSTHFELMVSKFTKK